MYFSLTLVDKAAASAIISHSNSAEDEWHHRKLETAAKYSEQNDLINNIKNGKSLQTIAPLITAFLPEIIKILPDLVNTIKNMINGNGSKIDEPKHNPGLSDKTLPVERTLSDDK